MKTILFGLLMCFSYANTVRGQGVAFSSVSFMNNDGPILSYFPLSKSGECNATRKGRVTLIAGGCAIVVGSGLLLIGSAESPKNPTSPSDQSGLLPTLAGAAFLVGGVLCVLAGGGEFIGGKIHDSRGRGRYSVIGSKNTFGLAYNF